MIDEADMDRSAAKLEKDGNAELNVKISAEHSEAIVLRYVRP